MYKMTSTDSIYFGIQDTLLVYLFVICICMFIVVMCISLNIYLSMNDGSRRRLGYRYWTTEHVVMASTPI